MQTAEIVPTTIEQDLHCIICDYNLRGLSGSGNCPECGNEIAISLRGERLSDADPVWLGRVSAGVTLLVIAAIAGTAVFVV
ncbi:MAG: hypothetical protein ACREJC_08565 [Tepidisphaeraceae bacterium]